MYVTVTCALLALGFWTSSHVSNPQAEQPSARYQVLAGSVTPTEEWASGADAPGPVHDIVRSTQMVLPSRQTTFVEKSFAPRASAVLTVAWLLAGMLTVPPGT